MNEQMVLIPRPKRFGMCRLIAVAGMAVSLALLHAPAAVAAPAPGDPVASGSVSLALSKGFKRQLKRNGVKMNRREFTIKKGTINPTDGTGSLTLDGRLKFRKRGSKTSFKRVTMTLGGKGALRGDGIRLFKISGGKVDRNGFGASITGIGVKLVRKGARRINRKLGLRSLHKGNAGTASVSEQPKTVRVLDGQTTVVPSLAGDSVALKLPAHCVNLLTGVEAIPPAVKHPDASFDFPVQGGSVAPTGKDGLILHVGGSQINKEPLFDLGACGSVPDNVNIQQTNLQFDLKLNRVFAEAVINGYPAPLGGPKGVAIAFDAKVATSVDASPNSKRVTIKGIVMTLSEASAQFLNLVFPNNTGDPARDFKPGDVFGTASTTVKIR